MIIIKTIIIMIIIIIIIIMIIIINIKGKLVEKLKFQNFVKRLYPNS